MRFGRPLDSRRVLAVLVLLALPAALAALAAFAADQDVEIRESEDEGAALATDQEEAPDVSGENPIVPPPPRYRLETAVEEEVENEIEDEDEDGEIEEEESSSARYHARRRGSLEPAEPIEDSSSPGENRPAAAPRPVMPLPEVEEEPTDDPPAEELVTPDETPEEIAPHERLPAGDREFDPDESTDDAAFDPSAEPAAEPAAPAEEESRTAARDAAYDVQPSSLNGVTPGKSTPAEVQAAWGAPRSVGQRDGLLEHVFVLPPFQTVTVVYAGGVANTLVVDLAEAFSAESIAENLGLARFEAASVVDDAGERLGQAYPERGVYFGFAPGVPGQVLQIILEPPAAAAFALRAEFRGPDRPTAALDDLDRALRLDPRDARAWGQRARLLSTVGRRTEALASAREAVRLDETEVEHRVALAKALDQNGDNAAAISELRQALAHPQVNSLVEARARLLLGELLAAGADRDFRQAAAEQTQALKLAVELTGDARPPVREQAREVLLDAHLAMAYTVAWGNWKDKQAGAAQWLSKAAVLSEKIGTRQPAARRRQLRIAVQGLAVCVGLQGAEDPTPWAASAAAHGQKLIEAARDPLAKQALEWELGLALYDALQAEHARGNVELAQRHGERAVEHLERGGPQHRQSPGYAWLMGRLYFRLGVIQAVQRKDHEQAVAWFERAAPLVEQPISNEAYGDVARQGETLVSMGVSYWEVGRRDDALRLTADGLELMELGVERELIETAALGVPYGNLAFMLRQSGDAAAARRYEELAAGKGEATRRR